MHILHKRPRSSSQSQIYAGGLHNVQTEGECGKTNVWPGLFANVCVEHGEKTCSLVSIKRCHRPRGCRTESHSEGRARGLELEEGRRRGRQSTSRKITQSYAILCSLPQVIFKAIPLTQNSVRLHHSRDARKTATVRAHVRTRRLTEYILYLE